MKTQVLFDHPAPYVGTESDYGILSVTGVAWFVFLLKSIPSLEIDPDLCQEDWGIVIFAKRRGKKFCIGLTTSGESEMPWVAHVEHGVFALIQSWTPSGKRELQLLVVDFDRALSLDSMVSKKAWHTSKEAFYGFRASGSPSAT